MANLSAAGFIDKLSTDSSFRNQLGIVPTMPLSEFRSRAAAGGYNYSEDEILSASKNSQDAALSDEDLADVSGGRGSKVDISITITIKF